MDRIQPGGAYTLANTRLLCAAIKTDGHVLAMQRKRWHQTFPIAHLWWLRKFIGDEARPFRSKKHSREAEDEVPAGS